MDETGLKSLQQTFSPEGLFKFSKFNVSDDFFKLYKAAEELTHCIVTILCFHIQIL